MRLTKNLLRHEIKCHCGCGNSIIDFAIVDAHQKVCDEVAIRTKVEKVVSIITSGYRCPWHNGYIKGKRNSRHQYGQAIDFRILRVDIKIVEEVIINILDNDKFDYYLLNDKNLIHLEYDPKEKKI